MSVELLLDHRAVLPAPVLHRRTHIMGEADLAAFRCRRIVVLSPHFDDACFSLGGFLARMGGGDLVNIFTQGDHIARRNKGAAPDQQAVYCIRDAEDAAFASRCGLRRHDMGCEEPSLRHRRPSDLRQVSQDIAQMAPVLLSRLQKLAEGFTPGTRGLLLAPLGVGRHVNHRAVSQLVTSHLAQLRRHYDVCLYEDQPYAASFVHRALALRRAGRLVSLDRRYAFATRWFTKRTLLEFYPSQHKAMPRHTSFWPRALAPFEPHEAFWSVSPLPARQEA